MKAVIMAGGEGVRLRPLSLGLPKPMTPLLDRPVLAHLIALLRRSGIVPLSGLLYAAPRRICRTAQVYSFPGFFNHYVGSCYPPCKKLCNLLAVIPY